MLSNIVRHAGATQATLELETMAGGVSLRAEDNGHGFAPLTVAEGLGLRIVRDAVALLGGTVAVGLLARIRYAQSPAHSAAFVLLAISP